MTAEAPRGAGWVYRLCEACRYRAWAKFDRLLSRWLCNDCWASTPPPGPPAGRP